MTERFKITWHDARYYVSSPNYHGGEVVDAASFDALVKALQEIENTCASYEEIMSLPDVKEFKRLWYVARDALAAVGHVHHD
jgi:hypothetical protein